MGQSFEEFLNELSKERRFLCNYDLFKIKLRMSSETYSYLTKAENLKDFVGALASGIAGGAIGAWTWWSSTSFFTQALIHFGIVAFPVAYPVVGGLTALTVFLGLKKIADKKKKLVREIPQHTTAPIDFLASTWLSILMPIVVKMAVADGQVHSKELETIKNNLVYKWGYCKEVVEDYLNKTLSDSRLQSFDYKDVLKMIDAIAHSDKGLNKEVLIQIILEEVNDVIRADEKEDPKEKKEYAKLATALGVF